MLLLREGEQLVAAAGAGELDHETLGTPLALEGSVAGEVLRAARPERVSDVPVRFAVPDEPLGIIGAETALLVPLTYRGRSLGVLVVKEGPEHFAPLAELCVAGEVLISIDRTFPLAGTAAALAHVGEGRALGKVVVVTGSSA